MEDILCTWCWRRVVLDMTIESETGQNDLYTIDQCMKKDIEIKST